MHVQHWHMCMNSWENPLFITLKVVDFSWKQVFKFAFEIYSYFDYFSTFRLQEFLKYGHSFYATWKIKTFELQWKNLNYNMLPTLVCVYNNIPTENKF